MQQGAATNYKYASCQIVGWSNSDLDKLAWCDGDLQEYRPDFWTEEKELCWRVIEQALIDFCGESCTELEQREAENFFLDPRRWPDLKFWLNFLTDDPESLAKDLARAARHLRRRKKATGKTVRFMLCAKGIGSRHVWTSR